MSHGPFGLIEGRQVNGGDLRYGLILGGQRRCGHRFADHSFGRGQFIQARGDQLDRHVEDFRSVGDQVGRGQVAVAVVGRLRQGVGQAGLDPLRAVPGDADRGGDRVGGLEADAPYVGGQPVRLGPDHGDRRVAVLLVDPHRQRRRHPDALEEDHHLLDRLLFGPGGGDHRGALGTQPVDLDQPAGLVLDDVHDVHAEMRHHSFGHHRADALDQPRSQVLLDAGGGGGQHGGIGVHLELPAVLRVAGPAAAQPQELAHLRAQQRPDRGDQLRAPLGRDPGDGVPGLRVGERHPLQHPVQHRTAALAGHRRWHKDNLSPRRPPSVTDVRNPPGLPLWYRIAYPGQHSVFLGRAHYRHGLRVPLEEHLLVMAPPRTYKTAFLADVILRYPGPVIATTTKADIYHLTSAVRAQHGRVHVFNPQHIGGVASTFCWSPVAGCEDPATAIRRADAFAVSQKGVEDGTFWSAKASDYLRGYFCAAALARYDLRAVAAWVSGADPDVPERILLAAGARQWARTLAELRSEAHKTVLGDLLIGPWRTCTRRESPGQKPIQRGSGR